MKILHINIILIIILFSCKNNDQSNNQVAKQKMINNISKSLNIDIDKWDYDTEYFLISTNHDLNAIRDNEKNIYKLRYSDWESKIEPYSLSSDISRLNELTHFIIDSRKINEIPESLKELKKMQYLEIDAPGLFTIPSAIGELKNLKQLIIGFADGTQSIPPEVFNLPKLEKLVLNRLYGESLQLDDDSFRFLKGLKELRISDTGIRLPGSIGELTSLEKLDLTFHYGDKPKEILMLENVKELKLGYLNNSNLDDIGQMKSIEKLYLRNSNNIPSGISDLSSLKELIFWEPQTNHFPITYEKLFNLETLKIYGTPMFKDLPEFVYNLPSLKKLSLISCDSLKFVDEKILKIKSLNSIDLRGSTNLKLSKLLEFNEIVLRD